MKCKIPILVLGLAVLGTECKKPEPLPNIIFILSDDLSWGDLGCFGQKKIETPNIDKIAIEGIKFTNAYAGNAVCAPSRSSLMEGKHPGHARVRGNSYEEYRESLQPDDYIVPMLLKQAGYNTGLFGKWGLALFNQPGIPNNMGFDDFFGYLNQQQAHCYYPEFLYHNRDRVYYPGNGEFYKTENYKRQCKYNENGKALPGGIEKPGEAKYAFDEYCKKSLDFIRENKNEPFFLYLAYTIPHGDYIVPELGKYKDRPWPIRQKEYASMVTRMDTEVGKLMNLLDSLGLDDNTLIFFASDNGPNNPEIIDFFNSGSPTRGGKGDSYDGSFHVPAIARWPGHIKPNQVSDHIWAFWDFLPTVAEILGIEPPSDIDGISLLPTLLGKGEQKKHDFLYWEYKQCQSVRYGEYFAHKPNMGKIELYKLTTDPQQSEDLSNQYPDIVNEIKRIMNDSHTPSNIWPSPDETMEEFQQRIKKLGIDELPENAKVY
ncbi:MAG: arylsulfatase [Bacteroidales bacterium]|nr:arylsulfatase [Bacteroidales bacterium]MCF8389577.1 arylsulfatase [Bacteroidales bacterium]